jgi:hypothetical protein
LKFNESRNMAWMDKVFLAQYDPKESRVDRLMPLDTPSFFFEKELEEIENELSGIQRQHFPQAEGEAAATRHAHGGR